MAWSSINAKQNEMIVKIDDIVASQKEIVATRDLQHKEIDNALAWLTPTVHNLARKMGG